MSDSSPIPGIIAPPPLLYLGTFALGVVAQRLQPLTIADRSSALRAAGVLLILLSAEVARWAFVAMGRQGTSPNPRRESSALLVSGPFKWSRNPIYLAMTGLYLGATALLGSWWPLGLLMPLLATLHWGVILREERYLLRKFGEGYAVYQSRVRRWL